MVFIVDLSHLEKPEDVRADDLGSWVCNGKQTMRCVVEDGCVLDVIPGLVPQADRRSYLLVKRYYKHATAGDFMVSYYYDVELLYIRITFRPFWRSAKQGICAIHLYW